MSKNNKNFFEKKNNWSEIKDRLLGCYLTPYFQKVLMTGKPIYYVDCFAGKGRFDDGNPDSPIIALEAFLLPKYCTLIAENSVLYIAVSKYVSFYLIRKLDTKSSIKLMYDVNPKIPTERINVNPVKNSYAALWDEYKEVKSAVPLMNVIRRILEYYFLQLCGYEGATLRKVILTDGKAKGNFKDENGNDDEEKFQLAAAMLAYINASSVGMNDGMNYVEGCLNAAECRSIVEMIFTSMNQKQHYDMMMCTDNQNESIVRGGD